MKDVIYTCTMAVILLLVISVGRHGLFPVKTADQELSSVTSQHAALEPSVQTDIRYSATDVASIPSDNGAVANEPSRVDVAKHASTSMVAKAQSKFKQPQIPKVVSPPKSDSSVRPDSDAVSPLSLLKRLQGISDYQ